MRLLLITLAAIVLSACAHDKKNAPKELPMTCARQNAMFEAGYHYYWSGDRLAIYSNNGDHYFLSDEESQAGYMFDLCNSGYYDGNSYDYDRSSRHRRNKKDRHRIRERNNRPSSEQSNW